MSRKWMKSCVMSRGDPTALGAVVIVWVRTAVSGDGELHRRSVWYIGYASGEVVGELDAAVKVAKEVVRLTFEVLAKDCERAELLDPVKVPRPTVATIATTSTRVLLFTSTMLTSWWATGPRMRGAAATDHRYSSHQGMTR